MKFLLVIISFWILAKADERTDFWREFNGDGFCADGYVKRQNFCCLPVSCGPNYRIEPCYKNLTQERCVLCDHGKIQLSNVSSLDYPDVGCYETEEWCPLHDMKSSRRVWNTRNFPLKCECDETKCYYDLYEDGVMCSKAWKICGINEQLNTKTGECESCPWYADKPFEGCHRCSINLTNLLKGTRAGEEVMMYSKLLKRIEEMVMLAMIGFF